MEMFMCIHVGESGLELLHIQILWLIASIEQLNVMTFLCIKRQLCRRRREKNVFFLSVREELPCQPSASLFTNLNQKNAQMSQLVVGGNVHLEEALCKLNSRLTLWSVVPASCVRKVMLCPPPDKSVQQAK